MSKEAAQQHDPQQDWTGHTNMAVGEILRRTRVYYNLRIEDVEGALRIRASQLSAIEDGQVEKLPGRVYAIGFVRTYSEFLGLDGDRMVHLFKTQMLDGGKQRPELSFPAPASESKVPNRFVLSGALAGLILVAAVFVAMSAPRTERMIPPVPDSMKKKEEKIVFGPPAPQPVPIQTAEKAVAIEPSAGKQTAAVQNRIVINVVDNAWVEIRGKDGKAIVSRILKKGDAYRVPDDGEFVMDTGNVGALEFTIDGAKKGRIGEIGDVKRAFPLDPENLLSSFIAPSSGAEPAQNPVPVAAEESSSADDTALPGVYTPEE